MKVFNTSFVQTSEERDEFSDITKRVREALHQFPVMAGIALGNTMPTPCPLFVKEFQGALVEDLKALMERVVVERGGYRHDDPRYSDCERGNAHAHLRAALLGRSIPVGVNYRDLTLRRFPSVIFAQFDRPPTPRRN